MTAPEWQYRPGNGLTYEEDGGGAGFLCRYGLVVQTLATPVQGCRDDPFGDGARASAIPARQAGLWVDRKRDMGVVWFATGMPDRRTGEVGVRCGEGGAGTLGLSILASDKRTWPP
ncbi:hypothetical protein RHOFW104T7_11895 [Rhodanobacter thiooxydans]|uniref:Uncharacterized protein n=1 Tax=Rhodanobacter thiooxydans TaxID=416169 RepID=A0A154QJ20_9GAMM|nr:hypothetical protein [Rhodanobacter thiooxydans]EIL98353.1 putative hydrolase [Rhodanobacter thiooxydans LCS2]KZC23844.1 hypothetical protein RHOFW104T7_11895 [Rhodanobacter thiooxydans]